jgi:hypothetical protein
MSDVDIPKIRWVKEDVLHRDQSFQIIHSKNLLSVAPLQLYSMLLLLLAGSFGWTYIGEIPRLTALDRE